MARTGVAADIASGLTAYAMKQAQVQHGLANAFAAQWMPIHLKNAIAMDWPQCHQVIENVHMAESGDPEDDFVGNDDEF